ncbi:transposase [Candidatus Amesbacteria bacterium]|nr:transposase [Candidatus Amesbacteria bacterium]MBI2587341.1 transposase [Candidatus Amesbacteria bacterium]
MSSARNLVFSPREYYHIFNRGVEKRPIFTEKRDYTRAISTIFHYRFSNPPVKFSKYLSTPRDQRHDLSQALLKSPKDVTILAYCLMPNHFHFLLRQESDNGISQFISKFSNSYTKFFNTKHSRVGPLLQGTFKAVLVESEEQLIHLSRYIHINPIVSSLIRKIDLVHFPWSSMHEYITPTENNLTDPSIIISIFRSTTKYLEFCQDHLAYAEELERIKHLTIDI